MSTCDLVVVQRRRVKQASLFNALPPHAFELNHTQDLFWLKLGLEGVGKEDTNFCRLTYFQVNHLIQFTA